MECKQGAGKWAAEQQTGSLIMQISHQDWADFYRRHPAHLQHQQQGNKMGLESDESHHKVAIVIAIGIILAIQDWPKL